MTKGKTYWRQFLVIFIIAGCMTGCKKEMVTDTHLENTNWHSTNETVYFPNGAVQSHQMPYDTWQFMSDHKITWINSLGIVAHIYTGKWHLLKDNKLVLVVNDGNGNRLTKSYTIISLAGSLLKVITQDVVIESGINSRSSKVEYEFKKY